MSEKPLLSLPAPGWYKRTERVKVDKDATGAKEKDAFFTEREGIKNQSMRQNMRERRIYSGRAYCLAICWTAFIMLIIAIQQLMSIWGKGLSEKEFIAVITTSTASVFGFWWLVGSYLFPKSGNPPKS